MIAIDRMAATVDGRDVLERDVTDAHGLHSVARRFPTTAVVHCGAFSGQMVSPDHPVQMIPVDVGGAGDVGERGRVTGGVRVVFAPTATA